MVLFLLGWSLDPDGMYCTLALFQDAKAWGNESCRLLSLLLAEVRGPVGQPLRSIRPPCPRRQLIFMSYQTGWMIDKCGKPDCMK
jgi:hypothetical protein